ncbi:MAG: FecR domain-containing protein [Burkholderiales bacterium]|nr:FecR domain-containing protein [Burkholderiales bacterium]
MSALRDTHNIASAVAACCVLLALSAFSSTASAQAKSGASGSSSAGSVCQGGYVHEASGLISIQRQGAKLAPAKSGEVFEKNAVFRTGSGEKAILKFADGQVVALGSNSAVRIARYCFLPNDLEQSAMSMELIAGQIRIIAGLIGVSNPRNLHIAVGESMLRIQKTGGADFIVSVNPDPKEAGYAVVQNGEISVSTPFGPIVRIATGQYAPWQSGSSPPLPIPFAAAPAVAQAGIGELLAYVLPNNSPVVVVTAAQTAAALAASDQERSGGKDGRRLAGYVQAISNTVDIKPQSGKAASANVGSTFESGTTVSTGKDGRAVLQFADGQIVILGPDSVLAIDQYQFDPANVKAGKSTLALTEGSMRFVGGAIQAENREGVSISIGASIIDIQNNGPADFTMVADTRNQEVGVARVTLGEISVHTPYGPIDKIKVGQSSLWGPGNEPVPVASALALVQAAVALQLSELPNNSPVAVADAAAASAAVAQANQAQAAASADPQNARLAAEAKAATELANLASKEATLASEAVSSKVFAALLETLPATAAGTALAQAATPAPPPAVVPIVPAVTPGAGGGSTQSGGSAS